MITIVIDTKIINLVLVVLFIILIYMYIKYNSKSIEGLTGIENMASVDEAISNVSSLYNSANMSISNLKVTGDVNTDGNTMHKGTMAVNGATTIGSDLHIGATMDSPGNMHISPSTGDLYLIPKKGMTRVGTEWGGNGNMAVYTDLSVGRNLTVRGVDIRDYGVGAIFYDHDNTKHTDGFYGTPWCFPVGKYRFNDDAGKNDSFDAVTINPFMRVKISGGWNEGDEWKVTWENNTSNPMYKRLDAEGARVNSATNIIIEKM